LKAQRSLSLRAWRLVATAAAAATVLGSGLYAGTTAIAATPDVLHNCTTGSSSGNVNTCMNIRNSGTTITDAIASATVVSSARTLLVCMTKPNGLQIGCDPTGWTQVKVGKTLSFEWSPDTTEPAGSYCAYTWRQDADGSEPLIGKACVSLPG